jgi:transposase
MATGALIAHVLVNKYSDHLPLYRQAQIFPSSGMPRAARAEPWPAYARQGVNTGSLHLMQPGGPRLLVADTAA